MERRNSVSQRIAAVTLKSEYTRQILIRVLQERGWKVLSGRSLKSEDIKDITLHWADFSSLGDSWNRLFDTEEGVTTIRTSSSLVTMMMYPFF